MKLGNQVFWRSQANGVWKNKLGLVTEVVAANMLPQSVKRNNRYSGKARDHESYIITILGKTNKYWPLVSALNLTTDQPAEVAIVPDALPATPVL